MPRGAKPGQGLGLKKPYRITKAPYEPATAEADSVIVAAVARPDNLAKWRFAQAVVPFARRIAARQTDDDWSAEWDREIAARAVSNRLPLTEAEEIARHIWGKLKGSAT